VRLLYSFFLLLFVSGCDSTHLKSPSYSPASFLSIQTSSNDIQNDVDLTDTGAIIPDFIPAVNQDACPSDMMFVKMSEHESVCVDAYEAPNRKGSRPLVMQSADDGETWCSDRGKRLCTEDEWTAACEGSENWSYPYGPEYGPGKCNDNKLYRDRNEDLLNRWPSMSSKDEVERLWQGDLSGERVSCISTWGVYDTLGNVEEWTRSRNPKKDFGHVLKGRFWASGKYTCQDSVRNHADRFRYYESGFRCCSSLQSVR
jgi:formylglycine-generating enzyme required for sulfatase activity